MIENCLVIDKFIVRGIQNIKLQNQVNLIYLDMGKSSTFNDFFYKISKQRFIYRFQLISITLSTNITNTDGEILIIYRVSRTLRNLTLTVKKTQSTV